MTDYTNPTDPRIVTTPTPSCGCWSRDGGGHICALRVKLREVLELAQKRRHDAKHELDLANDEFERVRSIYQDHVKAAR